MSSLDWGILIGGICTGRSKVTPKLREQLPNFGVVIEFPTLVHEDILVGACGSVLLKEILQPTNGLGFGHSGVAMAAMLHSGEVVSDKNPSSFTVKANVIVVPMLVRIKTRQVSIGNSFHLTFIAILLFMIVIFNAPGLGSFSKIIGIGIPLSGVLGIAYDFSCEHLVTKFLLTLVPIGNRLKVFLERVPEKEKSMESPW